MSSARGDPRQDAVRQRVADEGEAAQHHERAHDRAGDRDEHAREQRAEHELVVQERVDERTHEASGRSVEQGRACAASSPTGRGGHATTRRDVPDEGEVRAILRQGVAGQLHDPTPVSPAIASATDWGVPISVKMAVTPAVRIRAERRPARAPIPRPATTGRG